MKTLERKKCLLVINSLAGGGAERVFTTLVANLAPHRDECEFAVALLDDEEVEAYALPDWVKIHRIASNGSLTGSVKGLCVLVREWRPEVCLSFLTRANYAAVIAGRLYSSAVIISERVNTSAHLANGARSALGRLLVRLIYPRANHVIAVSQGVKNTLRDDFAVAECKMSVIPNPFDIAAIDQRGSQPPAFPVKPGDWATMGRLTPTKNAALAIRAFVSAKDDGRLFVLGDGPLRSNLETLVEELGAQDRIVLCGFLDNPHAILSRCDGYILPSDAEGFPNAMVEAMALGKPVVATDCPSGPAEIFETQVSVDGPAMGRGGMLVPCGAVAMMADAIRAMQDPGLRDRLGSGARARAMEFSVGRATESFWQVIRSQISTVPREVRA